MSSLQKFLLLNDSGEEILTEEDRRTNTRTKFLKSIRVRDVAGTLKEEAGTMIDVSRDGLYFTTRSQHYQVGMQLRVTIPETSTECTCKVARMEELPNGRYGVGVRLLSCERKLAKTEVRQ